MFSERFIVALGKKPGQYPGAQVYVLSDTEIRLTPYRETDHFRVTRQFLNYPDKMLELLFSE